MGFQEGIRRLNIRAILHRHGVDSLEEYEEKLRSNPVEWTRVDNELWAEKWINLNMENRGKTVKEYIRAVTESRIRD